MSEHKTYLKKHYQTSLREHGNTEKALGWLKGGQGVRFSALLHHMQRIGPVVDRPLKILDLGCGFGDFYHFLTSEYRTSIEYTGIDIVPEFINEAAKNCSGAENFILADFLDYDFTQEYDFVVASGTFNILLPNIDNTEFVISCVEKASNLAKYGIIFDFMSADVEYRHEKNYYFNPEVLYYEFRKITKRICIDNSWLPFEFTVALNLDDKFTKEAPFFLENRK